MFGKFQALAAQARHATPLLTPTLNSVGAEIGKPISASDRERGRVDQQVRAQRKAMSSAITWGGLFILLAYLVVIAIGCYLLRPAAMTP